MSRRTTMRWGLVALVLVLDVVTVAVDLFDPATRTAVVGVLTTGLAAFAALRVLDWRQERRDRAAAFAALRGPRRGASPPPLARTA